MKLLAVAMILLATAVNGQDVPFASFDVASDQVLKDPHDLVIGPDGKLYVADKFANRIAIMDPETLELLGHISLPLANVHDISFGPDGLAYAAATGSDAVFAFEVIDGSAEVIGTYPGARTEGVLAHSNGRIYVVSSGNGVLAMFDGDADPVLAAAGAGAHDVEQAPDGTIWVADTFNRRLLQFSEMLEPMQVLDAAKFGFLGPRYLDIDPAGHIIVADQDRHRILKIDPSGADGGTLLGVLGDGTPGMGPGKFDDPEGVEIDGGRYYFSDSDNNRIVRYSVVLN